MTPAWDFERARECVWRLRDMAVLLDIRWELDKANLMRLAADQLEAALERLKTCDSPTSSS